MTRKFTALEKEILYRNTPLQHQNDGCGTRIVVFFLFAFGWMFFDVYILLKFQNSSQEATDSDILMGVWILLLIAVTGLQCLALAIFLDFVRDIVVKRRYGKFALIKTFSTSKILLIQGGSADELIIQIFNDEDEILEIKNKIRIIVEHYFRENILLELSKHRASNSEKTDLSIFELIKLSKSKDLIINIMLKDFSTSAQFDFNENVNSFNDIFKSEYELVYSQKTKEFLFIDHRKGDPFHFQSDSIIKNVEDKIEFFVSD